MPGRPEPPGIWMWSKEALARHSDQGVDPRVYGGGFFPATLPTPPRGRSPRMRGRPQEWAEAVGPERSIPAYAGEARGRHQLFYV